MLVHITGEAGAGDVIWYCVSSAAPDDYGEVESIYVHPHTGSTRSAPPLWTGHPHG